MNYITIDMVKIHLRADFYDEDPSKQSKIDNEIRDLITKAEDIVCATICKNYSAIIKEYGEVPEEIIGATLIAIGKLYKHEDPHSDWAYNYILKPYKQKEN